MILLLNSLALIQEVENGNLKVLKGQNWLKYLTLTKESHINLERVSKIKDVQINSVLLYVKKTLKILDGINDCSDEDKAILEEVLQWCEVAKCGLPHIRKNWTDKNFNLFVHNVGSSQIYIDEQHLSMSSESDIVKKNIISTLILTHGLIGQYLRGEVNLSENFPLTDLITYNYVDYNRLKNLLLILNKCIIKAVSSELWSSISNDITKGIELVINNSYNKNIDIKDKMRRLRTTSIKNGEDFEAEFKKYVIGKQLESIFSILFSKAYLWYVEAALSEFSFEEFIKIFLLVYKSCNILSLKHISFEPLMDQLYYDYQEKKTINIYVKRILEKYLAEMSIEDILNNSIKNNQHVSFTVSNKGILQDTACFSFNFSNASSKLIEFCQEAENSGLLYEKSIIMLYDLFGFRRDSYDRFHNEESYLNTMNETINHKAVITDYVLGKRIIDIGPGGGALMDLLVQKCPDSEIMGLDISSNVIEDLKRKKIRENRQWDVFQGDVMDLDNYLTEKVDTFIFCSILHELFSYIPYEGQRFNYNTLRVVFKNVFNNLNSGGRIIIRDGIMTYDEKQMRIIRFKDKNDMEFLYRYCSDFQGRKIQYTKLSENEVLMPVNDAMEFLYTYTWGEESYNHEIQEMFGYFTPEKYISFIKGTLGEDAEIIESKHYLQEGYEENLLNKIDFFDENRQAAKLPDSTCLIVIQKK